MTDLARFVLRHPRKVLAAWLLVLILGAALASRLEDRIENGGYAPTGSQSQRAFSIGKASFATPSAPQMALVVSGRVAARRLLADARRAGRKVGRMSGVERVDRPLPAPDRHAFLVPLVLSGGEARSQRYVPEIEAMLAETRFGSAEVQAIGEAVTYDRVGVRSKESLQRSALISFPVLLVILLVAFLSVGAAVLPLSLSAVAVVVTFGLLYLLSYVVQLSVFVEDAVLVLGLGLSIDFSLFMVTRFREALTRRPGELEEAIVEAMQTTGRAILMSSLTIVVALAGLYVTGLGIFSSLATGAIGATCLALAAGLTLVPAMLFLVGERIERFPLRVAASAAGRGGFWRVLGDFVVRRRALVIGLTSASMLLLSLPLVSLRLEFSTVDNLPPSDPLQRTYSQVASGFGAGVGAPVVVLARTSPVRLEKGLAGRAGVVRVSRPEVGSDGWVRAGATLDVAPDSARAKALVREMRAELPRAIGSGVVVAGSTALGIDADQRIEERAVLVVAIVMVAEILVLTAAFGAPLIALKAALTTLLSVAAAMGVTIFFFGGGEGVTYFVPLFLFATVFGLSTDYEVFLLSRVREAHRSGLGNDDSIKEALARTGRSITLAGIAMSAVFFAFAISPLVALQEMGFGMGLAILLDVTVVRCLLVPAAVSLLGELNWWRPGVRLRPRPATEDIAGSDSSSP